MTDKMPDKIFADRWRHNGGLWSDDQPNGKTEYTRTALVDELIEAVTWLAEVAEVPDVEHQELITPVLECMKAIESITGDRDN